MKKLIKRIAAAASAVVICGVSCVTTWFSVPVSAAAGVGWLEWLEFQSLLQGIGVGGSNSDFADSVQDWIDGIGGAEMPREEYDGKWMTNYEYYNRLGWDSIIDWFDGLFSGDNSYKDVPDVGTDVSGGSSFGQLSDDGTVFRMNFPSHESSLHNDSIGIFFQFYDDTIPHDSITLNFFIDRLGLLWMYLDSASYSNWTSARSSGSVKGILFGSYPYSGGNLFTSLSKSGDVYYFPGADDIFGNLNLCVEYWNNYISLLRDNGYELKQSNLSRSDFLASCSDLVFSGQNSDSFIGPVYTYPAAQELYKSTGTAAGIRLDVQTEDGVPDIQAALDGAGVKTVDDLVAGVAAGTVPMSKVFSDAKVTPYVVADTATGAVVTDLGVSATAAGVKAVGLTQELAVPKDLTTAATYPIKGKTWDPEMSKYNLPLFQYFPFCLPWDIYQVLSAFAAEPVAPSFTIPVGKLFSGKKTFDGSAASGVSSTIDLGDDKFSKWFVILRTLESAGIVIGLVLISVKLIHGGR